LPSGQLHQTGAGQRGQRRNQQKQGKALNAAPNTGGREEFDIAEAQPLDFPESEIKPSQKPPMMTAFDSPRPAIVRFNQSGMIP
jgi:hypothetical protein